MAEALAVLTLLIEVQREDWGIHTWKEEAIRLVERSLAVSEPGVNSQARDVGNLLLAQGFAEFRPVLDRAASAES